MTMLAKEYRTLAKLGANIRMLLEKAKINPDDIIVTIGVRDEAERQKLTARMRYEFDGSVMSFTFQQPHVMQVHGVWIVAAIGAIQRKENA